MALSKRKRKTKLAGTTPAGDDPGPAGGPPSPDPGGTGPVAASVNNAKATMRPGGSDRPAPPADHGKATAGDKSPAIAQGTTPAGPARRPEIPTGEPPALTRLRSLLGLSIEAPTVQVLTDACNRIEELTLEARSKRRRRRVDEGCFDPGFRTLGRERPR